MRRAPCNYRVKVDGPDFQIADPSPFNPAWYSHKSNGAGFMYEKRNTAEDVTLVWAHGPFPAGEYLDLKSFKLGMRCVLDPGESVIADETYNNSR